MSVVFWTWLWGPVGPPRATPLTVRGGAGQICPETELPDVILGDEEVLEPSVRVVSAAVIGSGRSRELLQVSEEKGLESATTR